MSYSDRYKKNTNKFKSANPIFEEWISEWKEDAIAKDLQSKHTFSKCLNSLRKYPLPLKSGKECIILEGFGDKICKQIDEKLQVFLDEGGKLHEDEDLEILSDEENEAQMEPKESQEKAKSKKPKKTTKKTSEEYHETNHESIRSKYPGLLKQSNSNTESRRQFQKTKSWSRNSSDEDQVIQEEDEENLSKTKKAKKTTRSKEYVPEFRSGAYALLVTLYKREEEDQDESTNYMLKSQLLKDAQKHSDAQFMSHDPKNHYTAWNAMSNLIKKNLVLKENKLPARYRLTESGRELSKKILYGTSEDDKKPDSECEPVQPPKVSKLTPKEKQKEDDDECIEILDSDSEPVVEKAPKKATGYAPKLLDSSDSDALEDIDIGASTGLSQQFSNSKISEAYTSEFTSKYTSSVSSKSYSSSSVDKPNFLFTLLAGSYDIVLFVDNCETNAKKQDLLIDEIKKSNLKHDFGKLNVGDFAWVARSRSGSQPDLVLNYIVERKRMDDLCSSIIDGRYKEQKFRLKKSGITHAIYLIEEYGSMKHMSLPEKSLVQADVNTQIIDKLIVHHTTDPKDSAYYLIHMTKHLIEKFKDKTLKACSKTELENYRKKLDGKSIEDASNFLMTFKEFNEFSNKNKPLTVKEMFAKCLMKIQGLSQEKVLAILDVYPTPSHLIREYSKCSDENSRIKMLANIKHGSQQRNIGPAASKLIAQLFFTNAPLP